MSGVDRSSPAAVDSAGEPQPAPPRKPGKWHRSWSFRLALAGVLGLPLAILVILASAALELQAGAPIGVVLLLGSFFLLAFLVLRFVARRLFYGVGRRLLVSYVLVGVVPPLLIACFVLALLYVLAGQLAAVRVEEALDERVQALRTWVETLDPSTLEDGSLPELPPTLSGDGVTTGLAWELQRRAGAAGDLALGEALPGAEASSTAGFAQLADESLVLFAFARGARGRVLAAQQMLPGVRRTVERATGVSLALPQSFLDNEAENVTVNFDGRKVRTITRIEGADEGSGVDGGEEVVVDEEDVFADTAAPPGGRGPLTATWVLWGREAALPLVALPTLRPILGGEDDSQVPEDSSKPATGPADQVPEDSSKPATAAQVPENSPAAADEAESQVPEDSSGNSSSQVPSQVPEDSSAQVPEDSSGSAAAGEAAAAGEVPEDSSGVSPEAGSAADEPQGLLLLVRTSLAREYLALFGGLRGTGINEDMGKAALVVLRVLLVVTLVASGLIGLVAAFLVQRIAVATARLSRGFEQVERGDFAVRARLRGHDQLAGLVSGFNRMVGSLQQGIQERAEREAIERELSAAHDLQRRLLPGVGASFRSFEIGAHFDPAAAVGGDLYQFWEEDDGALVVVVGDVSGHGLATGIVMAASTALVWSQAREARDAGDLFRALDRQVRGITEPRTFLTLQHCRLDAHAGRAEVTNAAHPYPFRLTARGELTAVETATRPLGLALPVDDFPTAGSPLAPGDLWCFYSDGVVEATGPAGEPFGFDRLRDALARCVGLGASEALERLLADWRAFVASREPEDDVTLILVRVLGPTAGARVQSPAPQEPDARDRGRG